MKLFHILAYRLRDMLKHGGVPVLIYFASIKPQDCYPLNYLSHILNVKAHRNTYHFSTVTNKI